MKYLALVCTLYLCACGMTLSKRTSSTKWSFPFNTDTLEASIQKGATVDSLFVRNKTVHLVLPIPGSPREEFTIWRRTPLKIVLKNKKENNGLLFRIRDSVFVPIRIPAQK